MNRKCVSLSGWLLILILSLLVGSAWGGEVKEFRVCADPNNLPFSNQKLEGFENRIAELIAQDLGAQLTYTWWPHQRGLVRRTLNEGQCDVLIGIPKGWDLVLWTKPYYRTTYVIVYPKDRGFKIKSLDDPILSKLRIGVHVNTPPAEALAEKGIVGGNVIGYPLFYDPNYHPEEYPGKLIEDLIAGEIDVAIVWGPMAGYFVKKRSASFLELVPLQGGGRGMPFTFEISMGVKKGEKALKAQLEEVLDRRQAEIKKILEDYGVPLLAVEASGSPRGGEAPAGGQRGGSGHSHD